MSGNTQVVKVSTGGIQELLNGDKFKLQVAKALPKHLTPDRFIRVACTAVMRTPKLKECDQVSFFNSLLSLSQLGLEPDGRRAHLIPFFNSKRNTHECQLIVDYKGLVELAMRSGVVANIHADVICENDEFEYDLGEIKRHKVNFAAPRGEVYAAYALCRFKDGSAKAEVLSKDEVDGIRKRSKAGSSGPWVTDYNEMAKKTAFRRLSKWLPLSPEYRDALDVDGDSLEEARFATARNVTVDTAMFDAPVNPASTTGSDPDEIPMEFEAPKTETKPVEVVKDAAQSTFPVSAASEGTPAEQVGAMIKAAGASFDDFVFLLKEEKQIAATAEVGSLEEISVQVLNGWIAKPKAFAAAIKIAKGIKR